MDRKKVFSEDLIPRCYQQEMEEFAVKQNTIIYLPTGTGKTFITSQLLRRCKKDVIQPLALGGKRCFFLVNTVALVTQQRSMIENGTVPLTVNHYSSEKKVDLWKKDRWLQELNDCQVAVMTAQIFLDIINHGHINLSQVRLIIFDECHHAVNDHPMRQIMRQFEHCIEAELPRVLGLTATLLNSNVKINMLESEIRKLETTFHAKIVTVSSLSEVMEYSTNPLEFVLQYPKLKECYPIVTVKAILDKVLARMNNCVLKYNQTLIKPQKVNTKIKNNIDTIINSADAVGVLGVSYMVLSKMIQFELLKRASSTRNEGFFQAIITSLTGCRNILADYMSDKEGYDQFASYASPKVMLLMSILQEYDPATVTSKTSLKYNTKGLPLQALIFTKERFVAKTLFMLLKHAKECNKNFEFLKPDFIVGMPSNAFKSTREDDMEKKKNSKVLTKFRTGIVNILVTTNLMEEGIDIPECTLVVKFDEIMEYRSYVQSKGRARKKGSSFVMMTEESGKLNQKLKSYHEIEKLIQSMLVGKTMDRKAPTREEIEDDLYNPEINPYIVGKAKVTMTSAIQLLNRYCSSLPQDRFTALQPDWVLETIETKEGFEKFKVILHLPISCQIKEQIVGPDMSTKKMAKQTAALFACEQLHKRGELNDNLLPHLMNETTILESMKDVFFSHWPEDDQKEGQPKSGTKSRRRLHKRLYPRVLRGLTLHDKKASYSLYIHPIKIEPVAEGFALDDSQQRVFFNMLNDEHSYAILTEQKLPKMCNFSLFLPCGEVFITILVNYQRINLTNNEFDKIKRYHHLLFSDVLDVSKPFLIRDEELFDNCYFVVPVDTVVSIEINWNLINESRIVEPVQQPIDDVRKIMDLPSNYMNSVVSPWYRRDGVLSRYLVTDICSNMNPMSQFPNDNFHTYADYYQAKYNITVLGNKKQPLLEVKLITSRLNCLLPRAMTLNAGPMEDRRDFGRMKKRDDDTYKELLIPEFCNRMSYPGGMWVKANLLPSLLHRMTMLLQAEELRSDIAKGTSIGVIAGSEWEALRVDLGAVRSARREAAATAAPDGRRGAAPAPRPEGAEPAPFPEGAAPAPRQTTGDDALGEALYLTKSKSLDEQYPWDPADEPIDIDRNINQVKLIDLECHIKFMSAWDKITPSVHGSKTSLKAAICAAPTEDNKNKTLPGSSSMGKKDGDISYVTPLFIFTRKTNTIGPQQREVLTALTTMVSQDSINLERMEVLGDSFLKFAATLYLVHRFPTYDEGKLTAIKGQIIGNRNLYYCGSLLNLGGRMKVDKFAARSDWLPPAFTVPKNLENVLKDSDVSLNFLSKVEFSEAEKISGKLRPETWEAVCGKLVNSEEEETGKPTGKEPFVKGQYVQDKVVADGVEALIGVYLHSCGINAGLKLLSFLRILPDDIITNSLLTLTSPTPLTEGNTNINEIDHCLNYGRKELEKILGYSFKDPSLLLQALSHPSYNKNRITDCYQRLEFLGDAVLDLLVTVEIFEKNKHLTPGEITDLRSALVNNIMFACFTVRLGIHKYILSYNSGLEDAISEFVASRTHLGHEVTHETLYLIGEDVVNEALNVEVPKVLGDVFESLAGAVFLDSGRNLETVWKVFRRVMADEIELFSRNVPKHPIRLLYESLHASPKFMAPKEIPDTNMVMVPLQVMIHHKPTFIFGSGKNKSEAKFAAAKTAVRLLGLNLTEKLY